MRRIFILLGLITSISTGVLSFNRTSANSLAALTATWPTLTLVEQTPSFPSPVHITHAGDGSERLFVVGQAGVIYVLTNGSFTGIFLDISERVSSPASGGGAEEGLLSVAFPPDFANKNYFYVYYTNRQSDNQVSRFYLTGDPDQADPDSEELILYLAHPINRNHNGGQIVFGPDGYLYIGSGDGGGGGDPDENAQDPFSLLGKLLRIDVEVLDLISVNGPHAVFLPLLNSSNQNPRPYEIPEGNPFEDGSQGLPEVWALGLRNPWRFSFDRQNDELYIGDVGQNNREEVDFLAAGTTGGINFGWDILEGNACFEPSSNCVPPANYIPPVFTYGHSPDNCSVTGGYAYRGATYPTLQGIYLFADYCSGRIWGLQRENNQWIAQELEDASFSITSFGENEMGELFIASNNGKIYQVTTP